MYERYDGLNSHIEVDDSGVVTVEQQAARRLYKRLRRENPTDTNVSSYDSETKLHRAARNITHEFLDEDGKTQRVIISEHGAMVISHSIETDNGPLEIIYGPNPAGSPDKPGDVPRGGGKMGVPNNCEDVYLSEQYNQTMNFHGVLLRSVTQNVYANEEQGIYTFALTSNMIPQEVPHQDNIMYLVSYKFNADGSYTITIQTHNFGEDNHYLNEVFHPYFNTNKMPPQALIVGGQETNMEQYMVENEMQLLGAGKQMKKGFFISMLEVMGDSEELPALELVTTRYRAKMAAKRGFTKELSHIGVWTERLAHFWCLEMFRHKDEPYDLTNEQVFGDYACVKPGESSTLAISVEAHAIAA